MEIIFGLWNWNPCSFMTKWTTLEINSCLDSRFSCCKSEASEQLSCLLKALDFFNRPATLATVYVLGVYIINQYRVSNTKSFICFVKEHVSFFCYFWNDLLLFPFNLFNLTKFWINLLLEDMENGERENKGMIMKLFFWISTMACWSQCKTLFKSEPIQLEMLIFFNLFLTNWVALSYLPSLNSA